MYAFFYDVVVVFAMLQDAVNSSPKKGPGHVGCVLFNIVPVSALELHDAGAVQ